MAYQPMVYREQGGNALVIRGKSGGVIKGEATSGGTPAQAAHIANVDAATGVWTTTDKAKINTLLDGLRNCGILATS